MFRTLYPIIATATIEPMLGFYRDLTEATVHYQFTDATGQLAYVGLRVGKADLGIALDPTAATTPAERISLWAYVDDCDHAVATLRSAGMAVVEEPADRRWGERMAAVRDPDGNLLRLAEAADG